MLCYYEKKKSWIRLEVQVSMLSNKGNGSSKRKKVTKEMVAAHVLILQLF